MDQDTKHTPAPYGDTTAPILEQEIQRLKQDLAQRKQQSRPVSHSVLTAYRQTIANFENEKSQYKQ